MHFIIIYVVRVKRSISFYKKVVLVSKEKGIRGYLLMKKVYCLFFIVFCGLFWPTIASAEANFSTAINGFSYEVLFPENQKDPKLGYYDLLMKPNEKQAIQIKVNNTSNQPMKVELQVNSAKTNSNGVIEYGPSDLKEDPSLNYNLAKIMSGPDEIIIPANNSDIIEYVISTPSVPFKGYIAGGIQLKPIIKEQNTDDTNNAVINKFAYLIGVLISESEVKEIKPKLRLNSVNLKMKDARYTVLANISNTQPVYVEKITADIQITEKNKKRVLFKFKKDQMRMAPNSMIDIPISLDTEKVKSGEYTANIQIATESGNWNWMKDFKLSKIEAQQINKQIADGKENLLLKFGWVIIALLVLLSGVGYLILRKQKSRSKRRM